jgi:hypothetical protein
MENRRKVSLTILVAVRESVVGTNETKNDRTEDDCSLM